MLFRQNGCIYQKLELHVGETGCLYLPEGRITYVYNRQDACT